MKRKLTLPYGPYCLGKTLGLQHCLHSHVWHQRHIHVLQSSNDGSEVDVAELGILNFLIALNIFVILGLRVSKL